MKTKRKIVGRIFAYGLDNQHTEIHASDKADLVEQVQRISKGNKQAVQLAKLAWTDERSDITVGQMRLACIGQMVIETWGSVARSSKTKGASKVAQVDVPTHVQPQHTDSPPKPQGEVESEAQSQQLAPDVRSTSSEAESYERSYRANIDE